MALCESAAGVTAGIDETLRVAALLHSVVQEIQLHIQYAPEPRLTVVRQQAHRLRF